MTNLDEISTLMFGKGGDAAASQTAIFFGTALSDSADGEVTIQIDDPVYGEGDEGIAFEEVYLDTPDDDAESIGEDDDYEEEEFEEV